MFHVGISLTFNIIPIQQKQVNTVYMPKRKLEYNNCGTFRRDISLNFSISIIHLFSLFFKNINIVVMAEESQIEE